MLRFSTGLLSFCIALLASAHATIVTYTLNNLGGNDFSAEFTVTNDTLGTPIEEFTIFFPLGEYENLSITNSPTDWDGLAIEPDLGIPDDGFADWLALGTPIDGGATLSGFVVAFTFLGSGMPGDFLFDIVDPNTFDVLDTGVATLATASEIPIPGAVWLFAAGLLGLSRIRAA